MEMESPKLHPPPDTDTDTTGSSNGTATRPSFDIDWAMDIAMDEVRKILQRGSTTSKGKLLPLRANLVDQHLSSSSENLPPTISAHTNQGYFYPNHCNHSRNHATAASMNNGLMLNQPTQNHSMVDSSDIQTQYMLLRLLLGQQQQQQQQQLQNYPSVLAHNNNTSSSKFANNMNPNSLLAMKASTSGDDYNSQLHHHQPHSNLYANVIQQSNNVHGVMKLDSLYGHVSDGHPPPRNNMSKSKPKNSGSPSPVNLNTSRAASLHMRDHGHGHDHTHLAHVSLADSNANLPRNIALRKLKDATFPFKLHFMLNRPEHSDIIAWADHGKCWRVLNSKALESILPLYFRHGNFSSFQRQLYIWGFQRVTSGPDLNSYQHAYFKRDELYLASKMSRKK